jgi:DNA (cytosine-5)-methyltransferase 1
MSATSFDAKQYSVVDIFCGIGGLSHGFVKEGFKVKAGIDFDKSCKYAFEENNKSKFIYKDVTKLTSKKLQSLFAKGKVKILVGCAPCQPFSIYNHKTAKDKKKLKNDNKWKLLYSFADLIEKVKPDIVSMENVPLLLKFNKGKVFNDFKERLEKNGYNVTFDIVNAKDYGVPQRRKRLILFGSKLGEIKLIDKTITDGKYKTVRDTIGKLPPVEDGISHPDDILHRARKLTALNKRRIMATPVGGSWRDWKDKGLVLKCHKKKSGRAFGSVYGRMKWDEVAPTMTTYCVGLNNGRFGHPVQNRAITLREAALIQSFPRNYKFIAPNSTLSSPTIARQIGNAVPVSLGVAIARSIKQHLQGNG